MIDQRPTTAIVTSIVLALSTAYSQDPPANDESAPSTVTLNLNQLVSVEPDPDDVGTILLQIPAPETRTRIVNVTRQRAERRTRVVQVDGKQVEQQYTVMVPFVERVEQVFVVMGFKKKTVPVDKCQVCDLEGSPLEEQEQIDRLSSRPVVVALDQPWPADGKLAPRQRAVLRDDVLLMYVKSDPDPNAPAAINGDPRGRAPINVPQPVLRRR